MQRFMLKSKLHRATETDADLNYEGSISIDETLMDAAIIMPFEKVAIYNVSNGERFTTYAIKGKRNSGTICLNGAAARKVSKGDIIIIATYVIVEDAEVKTWLPKCVHLDSNNKIKPKLSKASKSSKTAKSSK